MPCAQIVSIMMETECKNLKLKKVGKQRAKNSIYFTILVVQYRNSYP